MTVSIERYANRNLASVGAAELLGEALDTALKVEASATLVVSGGSTPEVCFQHLATLDLPWHRVRITLTDERCVPADHPDSNERMVRDTLLRNKAATAKFVPMHQAGNDPFAAVLLGMGADGHFASLFPDATNLALGLDLNYPHPTINISTAASPHQRISMTLQRLVNTRQLLLLAFGDDKRVVLEQPASYPVADLLHYYPPSRQPQQTNQANPHAPCRVLWAK